LNLRVPAELRREIKLYAASHDKSMLQVILEAFTLYKHSNPG
jgi:hypothetical protein